MAGQGRNADGLTGSQPPDALNVVRFPGDWFGPVGDLVPIGTDADVAQDEQDLYAGELNRFGANSFWGEDAEDVHRVEMPVPVRARLQRSLGLRLLPFGGIAVAAVAVAAVLALGTQAGKPGHVSYDSQGRSDVANLAVASHPDLSGRPTASGRLAASDRERSDRAALARHTAKHGLPRSVGVRSYGDVTGARASTGEAVDSATEDVATPTGPVSPPPNATQLNP